MRSLTKFRSAYLFLNPWQKLFWLHIDQTVCALRLHCIMVGSWFRQKLQITTKDVSIWLRFIATSNVELMKSENFLRFVTDIFWSADYTMNVGSSLCLFISIPDTHPEGNNATIHSERIPWTFISVPVKCMLLAVEIKANSSWRGFYSR